ncbi:MAG: tetratricopeptide repeat protein [Phycisphaerae bacterium]|nr:tetratricopeptide repeat protein [Phycisphaerae bacterium]
MRRICTFAMMASLMLVMCGCRKPAAPPPAPTERAGEDTRPARPAVETGPSQLGQRGRALARRAVEELGDTARWKRISLAGLRAAGEACDKNLADPITHIRAGDKALANGQTELAIGCFQRAVALTPKNADAHKGLAVALTASAAEQASGTEAERRYHRAARVYRAILAISAGDETARFNLGLALMRSSRYTEADEAFRPLLKSAKFGTEATFNLSVVLASQGKLEQAEGLLRRLIRTSRTMGSSDLAAAHTHLGEVLMDLDDTEGALEAYTEAARLTPKDVAAWLNLAVAARAHGSYGYAVTATRKAAQLSPFNAEIHLRLGNLLLELHRATGEDRFLREAVEAWRDSVKIDPSQTALSRRVKVYSQKAPATQPATATDQQPTPM